MFCSRFEDEKELEPLTSCAEYQRRREMLEAALEIGENGDTWQAVLELLDIVSQFYYCSATSFLRNLDKINEKKRDA